MLSDNSISKIVSSINSFNELTRLKILFLLKDSPANVKELQKLTSRSQSAISHHLAVLRSENLVKYEKDGRNIIYSLSDRHIYEILSSLREHVLEKNNSMNDEDYSNENG